MLFGEEDLSGVDPSLHQYFLGKNETTTADLATNYTLGILIIMAGLLSLVLNPLSFYLNYLQPTSTARMLFLVLAISDFLTNLWHPWVVVRNIFKPSFDPPCREATIGEQVDAVLFRTLTWSSIITTCLLSVCRFIKLKFPFAQVRTWYFLAVYGTSIFLIFVFFFDMIIGLGYYEGTAVWFRYCQLVWKHVVMAYEPVIIIPRMVLMSVVTGTGILSSLLAIAILLLQSDGKNDKSRTMIRSSIAIAIMNVGNFSFVVVQILYAERKSNDPVVNFLAMATMPMLCSALNPTVLLYLSTALRSTFRNTNISRQINLKLKTMTTSSKEKSSTMSI